jgi:hypothetical protein
MSPSYLAPDSASVTVQTCTTSGPAVRHRSGGCRRVNFVKTDPLKYFLSFVDEREIPVKMSIGAANNGAISSKSSTSA